MQQKEKLLHTTRRAGLRLICLIAALLALSPYAEAYQDPRLCGDNFGGYTYKDNAKAKVIECDANSTKTFTVDNWPGGYFKISAPYGDWSGEHLYSNYTSIRPKRAVLSG